MPDPAPVASETGVNTSRPSSSAAVYTGREKRRLECELGPVHIGARVLAQELSHGAAAGAPAAPTLPPPPGAPLGPIGPGILLSLPGFGGSGRAFGPGGGALVIVVSLWLHPARNRLDARAPMTAMQAKDRVVRPNDL